VICCLRLILVAILSWICENREIALAGFNKPIDYLEPNKLDIIYDELAIKQRLQHLSSEIVGSLGQEFLVVGILKGSFVFIADLVRSLHQAGAVPQVEFITISSYGDAKESSGKLKLGGNLSDDVRGKKILLCDDILESGRTVNFAKNMLLDQGANQVAVAVLLDKPMKRKIDIEADFVGFSIEDFFVVGYGLDYAGYYRELPFIGKL
jgi:hypoxanthine phosphoribosyltransferase